MQMQPWITEGLPPEDNPAGKIWETASWRKMKCVCFVLMVQCVVPGAMAFSSAPQGMLAGRSVCATAGFAVSCERKSKSCAQAHTERDADTAEPTQAGKVKFAELIKRRMQAAGISTILPIHRSSQSIYPKGTRGARRPQQRALYCKLSDKDKERLRFSHEQDMLADELRFLGVFVIVRSLVFSHVLLSHSCLGAARHDGR